MNIRNCLYIVSILAVVGCSKDQADSGKHLQSKLDSLTATNSHQMDSLMIEIQNLQGEIEQLKANNQILADSITSVKELQSKAKIGPKISPTIPRGDPIEVPIQKRK